MFIASSGAVSTSAELGCGNGRAATVEQAATTEPTPIKPSAPAKCRRVSRLDPNVVIAPSLVVHAIDPMPTACGDHRQHAAAAITTAWRWEGGALQHRNNPDASRLRWAKRATIWTAGHWPCCVARRIGIGSTRGQ
jgi:hypothetical protein